MGYILLVSEKPDAMRRIAEALADSKSLKKKESDNGVSYYEFKRNGKKHIIVCAVGHLFNLSPVNKGKGWYYPIFDAEWKPSFQVRKESAFSKKYFEVIEKIGKGASDYIVCTDFDTEGSVIGYNVLRFLCGVDDGKRMKFSTLTKDELISSYQNMSKHLDFQQIEAGLTRHQLDWIWGINLTRALTLALKNHAQKGFAILSSGRVQSPTLAILLERELEIRKFKPKPFWELELHVKIDGIEAIAAYGKGRIWEKEEADKVLQDCKGKDANVKDVKKKKYKQAPPVPFNTTDLQSEAYQLFKFSPQQTMNIAESLYQQGFISYPRSSSQKLPPSINYEKILKALASLPQYKEFAERLLKKEKLMPVEGKKDDPAHPALYATQEVPNLQKLTPQQRKIYDLIARRTLAVFADEAIRETNTVSLDVNGYIFLLVGKRTLEPGWTEIYEPYLKREELILPELKIGQTVKVIKLEELAKETQPPARYSQGSIIKEMEARNLGTRATRAEILQTLYDRGYISRKSIQVTKLGEAVVKALKEYSPRIISEELTRKFEEEMDLVLKGEKKREEVVEEAKETLTDILKEFKENERKIGKKLLEGLATARQEERRLGVCPNCKTGELRIMKSRFSGKIFVGCSNYFRCAKCGFTKTACKCKCEICGNPKGECKCSWKDKKWYPTCQTGYPLPNGARIQATGKVCEKCNTPIIQVWRKGKRPFRMCLSTTCETKKDWSKKKVVEKTE
jgi:DNA topoisomerase-1